MIEVPDAFARSTVEREGESGVVWLAELPGIVEELLGRWGYVPDGPVVHGGVGVIVPVRERGGTAGALPAAVATPTVPAAALAPLTPAAVLKVSFPHPGNVHEPDAFETWGGRGAVQLYRRDDRRYAMLLERARASTLAEVGDEDEIVTVAGRLNRRLAVPAPPGLPRLRERTGIWAEELRAEAGRLPDALPRHEVDAAVATLRELGHDRQDTVLHGDLHARNILRADREPWLAVDPKGYAGDPAYDGGTLLKSRALSLLGADDLRTAVHRVLDGFSEAAELDRERVRRWAQFHAVQAAFHGRRHGFRVARGGPRRDRLTAFVDRLAGILSERTRSF
ncbi:aminoglycoside phosphotransferase family protein [Streptomyces sp. NBC_00481]|uniref:aminoglycoside phosphotransferase family protein n=1 Tax=Streptomyces sp. NBC_00481 TaxID=2975755 RepID=UPI002DDB116D|nr:aminoglycoside phosphotransferase family protein [Streptomyces sp. NBC_00481]WRY98965.1 aminoglycoside phosphotransferase family protein [Streptomyces sp. NBC_00481]